MSKCCTESPSTVLLSWLTLACQVLVGLDLLGVALTAHPKESPCLARIFHQFFPVSNGAKAFLLV